MHFLDSSLNRPKDYPAHVHLLLRQNDLRYSGLVSQPEILLVLILSLRQLILWPKALTGAKSIIFAYFIESALLKMILREIH